MTLAGATHPLTKTVRITLGQSALSSIANKAFRFRVPHCPSRIPSTRSEVLREMTNSGRKLRNTWRFRLEIPREYCQQRSLGAIGVADRSAPREIGRPSVPLCQTGVLSGRPGEKTTHVIVRMRRVSLPSVTH